MDLMDREATQDSIEEKSRWNRKNAVNCFARLWNVVESRRFSNIFENNNPRRKEK